MSGVYSFMDVSATIAGVGGVVDLGYGASVAEEGISIVQTEDRNLMTVGADGEVMHTLRAGKSGTHDLVVEPYGYRWFRVGGLNYALNASRFQ